MASSRLFAMTWLWIRICERLLPEFESPIVSFQNSCNSRGGNFSANQFSAPVCSVPSLIFFFFFRARARPRISPFENCGAERREFGRAQLSKKSTAISLECNFHAYDTICGEGGREGYLRKFRDSLRRKLASPTLSRKTTRRTEVPSLDSFSPSDAVPTEFYRNDKVDFRNYRSLRLPDDFSFRSDISRRWETRQRESESCLLLLKDSSFFD